MADFPDDSIVSASQDQVSCRLDEEAVILHAARGVYYSLEGAGAVVWERLRAGPASVAELARAVTEEFDVAAADARRDLEALLEEMVREGLITVASPRPCPGSSAY